MFNSTEIIYRRWSENKELQVPKTPLGISGILLNLLIDHFTYNSQQFKYSPIQTETKILIDMHQQWKPENCENYPGIYVKRQNWIPRAEGRVLADHKSFDLPDGVEYWIPITTNYSFICVGNNYGELEILLSEVGTYFTVFWEPICSVLNFNRIDVVGVSPVQLIDEAKGYRSGQVDLTIMFSYIWKLTLEKPLIQKIRPDISHMP